MRAHHEHGPGALVEAPDAARPNASASMRFGLVEVGSRMDAASTVSASAASTMELSIFAVTVLWIALTATAAPTPAATDPRPLARITLTPPVSARMSD